MRSTHGRHRTPALLLILAAGVMAALLPGAAEAHQRPTFLTTPTIVGAPLVGSTLTAVATYTQGVLDPGDPPVTVAYEWRRCPATTSGCRTIAGATSSTYTTSAADRGLRLRVRVTISNSLGSREATAPFSAVISDPPPPPPPPGTNPPPATNPPPSSGGGGSSPAPTPSTGGGGTPTFESTGASPPVLTAAPTAPSTTARRVTRSLPAYLRPFPVVRIRGFFRGHGVRVTMLSVAGPRRGLVRVRCAGRGCPVRSLGPRRAPARLRAFERYLPAGVVLEIRVGAAGRIGKFTRLRIRDHRAPARSDGCVMPLRATPVRCPITR